MRRTLGPAVPAFGLALGVLGLALWVAAITVAALDLLVGLLLLIGVAMALAGYVLGDSERTRRLGVIGLGWNAAALAVVAILYAGG